MNGILIPVVLVVGIGLIAGIILTIAAKMFYVPVDETAALICDQLPGANCGGCGFAGCNDYATALAKDKCETLSATLCVPGGSDVTAKIALILGIEAETVDPRVAIVRCNGSKEMTKTIMDYEGIPTCKAAKQFYGGQWACSQGCLGLGDCTVVCQYDAINVENGVAIVDREKCIGCGLCARTCPNNVIIIGRKRNTVYVRCSSHNGGAETKKTCDAGCIGCKKCENICKFDAVHVENNLAVIDFEKCRNCGMCEKECPTHAIINLKKKN